MTVPARVDQSPTARNDLERSLEEVVDHAEGQTRRNAGRRMTEQPHAGPFAEIPEEQGGSHTDHDRRDHQVNELRIGQEFPL